MGRRSETPSAEEKNDVGVATTRRTPSRYAAKRKSLKEISEAEDNDEEVEVPTSGRPPRAASKRTSLKEKIDEESDEEEVVTPSRKRKPPKDEEDEKDEDHSEADTEGSEDEEATAKPSSSKKKRKSSKKPQPKDDADESENEENEKPLPKKSGRKKKVAKDEEEEYEVERIVDDRAIKGRIQYKIRWKGYLSEDDTWENESTLDCTELIEEYNDAKGDDSRENGSSDTPAAKPSKSKGRPAKTETKKGKAKQEKPAASDGKRGKDKKYGHNAPDKNGEWEVLKLVDMHTLKNGSREFLVRWKGYPPEDDSWEPEAHLKGTEILERFLKKVEQNAIDATPSRSGGRRTARVRYNYKDEQAENEEDENGEEDARPRNRGRPRKTDNGRENSNPALGGVTLAEIEKRICAAIDRKQLAKQDKLDEIHKSVAKQENKFNELLKSVDELRKENETLRQAVADLQSKMTA